MDKTRNHVGAVALVHFTQSIKQPLRLYIEKDANCLGFILCQGLSFHANSIPDSIGFCQLLKVEDRDLQLRRFQGMIVAESRA